MLSNYFDFVAAAVTARGSEIHQFIGDPILMIFRIPRDDDRAACYAALDSALDALYSLALLNSRRVRAGQMVIRFGVGRHVEVVTHGNVGSLDRLGFNVVGRAVNRTAWIEAFDQAGRRTAVDVPPTSGAQRSAGRIARRRFGEGRSRTPRGIRRGRRSGGHRHTAADRNGIRRQ
jgi:class 3 adenylate cyclase